MSATEFRAKCYRLLDEVAETGRELVIMKRGRAVMSFTPHLPLGVANLGCESDIIEVPS